MKFKTKRRNRKQSVSGTHAGIESLEPRRVLTATIPTYYDSGEIGESGTVQVSDPWITINLNRSYESPVVIAGPASMAGGDPLSVRVRSVTSNSFQLSLGEWDYLDGNHISENVSYLVVEAGRHELTDGTMLVAGFIEGQDQDWTTTSLGSVFDTRPVVLSQIMTQNGSAIATTRTIVQSNNEFDLKIQEEEDADNIHSPETVGFVAVETGVGVTGGQDFQAILTSDSVTDQDSTVAFSAGFSSAPSFFANMQSTDGEDTANLRYRSRTGNGATIFVDEEQALDTELAHTPEVVGVLAVESGGIFSSETVMAELGLLERHITGDITLSFAELESLSLQIDAAASAGAFADHLNLIGAVDLVELYEATHGALFTNSGTKQFTASWATDDGDSLARVMNEVYLAVFKSVDADLISSAPDIVDGLSFGSSEFFPGAVPSPTDPNAVYQAQIDATQLEAWGSDMIYDAVPVRRMTGAYASPGSVAEVTVPQALVNSGYTIRVGAHVYDLSSKTSQRRLCESQHSISDHQHSDKGRESTGGQHLY